MVKRSVLLILASTYPRWKGDPEPGFVHELAQRCTSEFEVIALVPSAPGALSRETMDGVEVIRYRYAPSRWESLVNEGGIVTNLRRNPWKLLLVPGFVLMQAWHANRLRRTCKVDVVHAHWLLPQGLIAAILRGPRLQGPPFVVTSHGADLYALNGRLLNYLKRMVVRRSSAATVVSRAMQEELERIGAGTGKVIVRSMGVDLENCFAPSESEHRSSNEILFVGRLVEKKGVRYLIDAMPLVLAARPDARLVIVGFGPEETALRDRVRQLDLDAQTTFAGAMSQAQLPLMYRRAAVLAAPFVQAASGDREGLGLVTAEALGCGCPVVTTDIPATLDVMPGVDGFMRVAAGDAKALAAALLDVLENAHRHRNAAMRCREELLRRLDWTVVAREYRQILSRAVGRNGQRLRDHAD